MPRLLKRHLRCHYCSTYSRNDQPGIPRTWFCPHCEAQNHFDERGEILDPPLEVTIHAPHLQYARSRSPTPPMPPRSPFCDNCQHNQMLVNKLMAEYIPDEDDPNYKKYVNSVDDYRADLEQRYPQVCETCIGQVRDQIRAAGYATKTDHLRRILEQSKKIRDSQPTPRQIWTLRVIALSKWIYILSVTMGVVWHIFGTLAGPDERIFSDEQFRWSVCLAQAVQIRETDQDCLISSYIRTRVRYALWADLLTIWWNPQLKQKTLRPLGRMQGLKRLWALRAAILAMRCASLYFLPSPPIDTEDLRLVHYIHASMLALLLVFSSFYRIMVRTVPQSIASFMRPIDPILPNATSGTDRPTQAERRLVRPDQSSFDTMAQSFTSSFPTNSPSQSDQTPPPSPTLTEASTTTHDTETSTPWLRNRGPRKADDGAMDWTPTQRKFTTYAPDVLPSLFQTSPPTPQNHPNSQEGISLFSKPDPNPFRHKVPAAPKAPAQAKHNPWRPGVWAPPLKETKTNFFKEDRSKASAVDKGLEGVGVPKNVQRDAELFEKPKLKYDYYGTPKETGLEDTFNSLFSK